MDMRARIEATIQEKKRSVRGVSIAAGMGETTLRNFLKGMTNSFTIESAEKIADELGVSAQWLIFGTGEAHATPPETAAVVNLLSRMDQNRREIVRDMAERLAKEM